MSETIPEGVKNFIFEYIDSVELLETLLLFYADPHKTWNFNSLAANLRSNPRSIEQRCAMLESLKLIQAKSDDPNEYFYKPDQPEVEKVIAQLAEAYRIQRHRIFALIFSPMKKARDFADAFYLKKSKEKKEDPHG